MIRMDKDIRSGKKNKRLVRKDVPRQDATNWYKEERAIYFGVEENFLYPLTTLLTESKKSFSDTDLRRARMENMPASVQTECNSAPVVLGQRRAMSSKRISRSQFIRLE